MARISETKINTTNLVAPQDNIPSDEKQQNFACFTNNIENVTMSGAYPFRGRATLAEDI